jgi:D-threo-aldose 1-dehydrogenase
MKRHPIGRTDVQVTEIGFGGAPLGNLYTAIDDESGYAAVRAAWDGGILRHGAALRAGVVRAPPR